MSRLTERRHPARRPCGPEAVRSVVTIAGMDYLIGDVQGCDGALGRLLDVLGFSPSRDRLLVLGDLVNRGPASLATLRRLRGLGSSAVCLLGNHDLHLLAVAHGVRPAHRSDTLDDILQAPDRDEWLDWVRARPLSASFAGWLCVHAGVPPQWDAAQTLALGRELQALLGSSDLAEFLPTMYGNEPARWDDALRGADRWRCAINALTRIRFCRADGTMEFATKDGAAAAPPDHCAWFDWPHRRTAGVPMAFGHWSTLGLLERPDLLSLDTGCVWGGPLSAMRVDGGRRELTPVDGATSASPGHAC
jgi:bis(5'-nucleosyl)-tetraphosphatase (symmetrical)